MDKERTPEISVIIVNWNGRALLEECLQSLEDQTFQDFEIILVDNGSTDGSAAWVEKNHPRVRLLALGSNTGFSAGNNAGLDLARGEFIALLNNDTKAEAGWLEALYRGICSDGRIAACDSMVLYYDQPGLIWSAGGVYTIAGSVSPRLYQQPDRGPGQGPQDVFIAVACAAIYRMKVVREIGLFDEAYFNGYEDVDWSFRAHLSGHRIVNVPAARVYHKVSSTQIHNSPDFVYNGQRNVSATFIKNMPGWLFFKYLPLHLAYALGSFWYFAKVGQAGAFLRAKRDLVRQIPALVSQRNAIQTGKTVSSGAIDGLLEKNWLTAKVSKYRKNDHAKG
ncbi:MAG: glycosyltransferase family 2 protein [bacterium]|nr:glycosyltransferase family 2 protein [bacterium]